VSLAHIKSQTVLKTVQCGTCGVLHALPECMYNTLFNEGGYWYCPNGHQRGWTEGQNKRDEKDLKNKLAKEVKRREWAEQSRDKAQQESDHQRHRANGYKGQLTKVTKRIKAGICPCCNRTFKQLAAHMKNKHPNYSDIN